jgi:hypothetical protein
VREKLLGLVSGGVSREAVAEWAAQWVRLPDPEIDDAVVWKALTRLAGADMISTDRPYLYDENDFNAWCKDLSGQQ